MPEVPEVHSSGRRDASATLAPGVPHARSGQVPGYPALPCAPCAGILGKQIDEIVSALDRLFGGR